ncbi:DNA cytosine methyltransferase [Ectopseudomonas khazarica]|uniref:DNA cytosine methyltransferase n=1 Tax=Ectopseudomonas khazarica TaxID=2502979 RepID=UPI0040331DC6
MLQVTTENDEGLLRPGAEDCEVSEATSPMKPSTVKCVDLFAGAGGFSLGAIRAGIDVVGALEINQKAAKTYSDNIPRYAGKDVPVLNGDILSLEPDQALQRWEIEPGSCDLIIGGPPCQGFSSHRIKDQGVGDPRNALLCRYFDYVKTIRPRVFLVENVPGLLWPRHREYLQRFYEMGREAEYNLFSPAVLNACDFGVPQNRKRVFILGIDSKRPLDIQWPPIPTHVPPNAQEEVTGGKPIWKSASVAFYPAKDNDPNDIHMNHSTEMVELFKRTPINGGSRSQSGRTLKCHEGHGGHNDVYGRINPAKPAPTMTTACINPSKGRFVHPTENHGITLRQAARFQTFPDDFVFSGGLMAAGEQIGNAVPVDLATAIIKKIYEALTQQAG